jgi:hypothetical protein
LRTRLIVYANFIRLDFNQIKSQAFVFQFGA